MGDEVVGFDFLAVGWLGSTLSQAALIVRTGARSLGLLTAHCGIPASLSCLEFACSLPCLSLIHFFIILSLKRCHFYQNV
jgi:hypothetical protein